jgi:hypothetical protein
MDISHITNLYNGRLYQSDAPDDEVTHFDIAGRRLLLIEMAAGIDALHWVRTGDLTSVLYFGIEDSPQGCLDDASLISLADMACAWLRNGGDVLSGCAAGVSRSSYANCAILMVVNNIEFDAALAIIRAARPQANPNDGFVAQLRRLGRGL